MTSKAKHKPVNKTGADPQSVNRMWGGRFDAGADGFIYEPMTDFDYMVEKYGDSKVIVGSKVDCGALTFGDTDDIRREIDATLDVAFDCPGFVFAVGNHIPSNVPVANAVFYMEYLREHWSR